MRPQDINIDDAVFLADGGNSVAAVRKIMPHGRAEIVIYVENAGDFTVPMAAVKAVHFGKVILDLARLDAKLRTALGHSHDAEDPRITEREDEPAPLAHRRPGRA